MKERYFRLFSGSMLLAILYFHVPYAMMVLLGVFLFEGITNYRVTRLFASRRNGESHAEANTERLTSERIDQQRPIASPPAAVTIAPARPFMQAERALLFVLIALIAPSYFLFYDVAWPVPWFVGFALVGAGMSGICPMVNVLRRLGLS